MEFFVKSIDDPAEIIDISPEVIANQRVGTRIAFRAPRDIVVEFANGTAAVESVELIIYIVPEEYFCYRGDEMVLRFQLACRNLNIDCRPACGNVNGRAILSGY